MPGKAPRRKGNGFEGEVVNKAKKEFKIPAQRMPNSGSSGGRFNGDLVMEVLGQETKWECKRRGGRFSTWYKWIDGVHGIFFRDDDCEMLATVRADYLMQLIQAAGYGRWHLYPLTNRDEDDAE